MGGRLPRHISVLLALCAAALAWAPSASAAGQVQAGAAVVDGTYHVGNSAGQYASTRDGGYGDVDPHAEQGKNMASYGVQSRESVRAIVIKGADGQYVAILSDDHYIPQDALWRRTAQLLDADTGGKINERNLVMAVTHNHSSPSYSSFDWGVWSFQDVFDFRFFDYYAHQNARAVEEALGKLQPIKVSATASYLDAFQKNPIGPGWADDGSPAGFPRPFTDHDLSVVRFETTSGQPVATLANYGEHPEDLEGYDLISGEYPAETERMVDRSVGGVTIVSQNATGTSEVEEDRWHPVHDRELTDHAQYNQMEWVARQLSSSIVGDVNDIGRQHANSDRSRTPYGGTSYHDRFVRWTKSFPVAMDDRWFGGPISHPYPGVSSCRTDAAFQGDPRIPVAGLPNCVDMPWGTSLQPVTTLGGLTPGVSTDTFEALGIPIPENYSAPSTGALEDTVGVHMQAIRLGDILVTVCSCEQWVEQSYNIKTRTDQVPGNEYLGYDATASNDVTGVGHDADEKCVKNGDGTYGDYNPGTGTWKCTIRDVPSSPQSKNVSDKLVEHMRAQVLNDASSWDDPNCQRLGCGAQAESEPTDLRKVFGNFTHDDTTVRGGQDQSDAYAQHRGYKLTVTMAMANDYNGYIASYREYMNRDHYRKALTGWGPHSSDYYATRLSQMGHELAGDKQSAGTLDEQTDVSRSGGSGWAPMAAKEAVDQRHEDAKVRAVGEAAHQGVAAYDATLPNDGGSDAELTQPKSIERFDAATFTWDGGNNYTDNPDVRVQRLVNGSWQTFADESGEVPVVVHYPGGYASYTDPTSGAKIVNGMVGYRAGGQVWKWTATFEAFVSRFPLVDPQGNSYLATPPGTYRFLVHGTWRKGGGNAGYDRMSDPFQVRPWSGITVDGAKTDSAGHMTFSAGPTHQIAETTVRRTSRPPFNPGDNPVTFTIGPVDFPDHAADQGATGFRFLNSLRGYSGTGMDNVEHYCLDCSFRPWLDATGDLTAHLAITRAGGRTASEDVKPGPGGNFTSRATLGTGDTARITIDDAWGDTTGNPVTVTG